MSVPDFPNSTSEAVDKCGGPVEVILQAAIDSGIKAGSTDHERHIAGIFVGLLVVGTDDEDCLIIENLSSRWRNDRPISNKRKAGPNRAGFSLRQAIYGLFFKKPVSARSSSKCFVSGTSRPVSSVMLATAIR